MFLLYRFVLVCADWEEILIVKLYIFGAHSALDFPDIAL